MPPLNQVEASLGNSPRPAALQTLIRFLAEESSQVIITNHAEERMLERGITSRMLFDTLKCGIITGGIEPTNTPGDFKVKLTNRVGNGRHVGVVTVVKRNDRLIIVTVEWEDGR
ncbi:DUF4258 domain-containing protein [Paracoccus sp. (in: a-proteobacteria)]|uniref:DUF4258 domain-containing protein n=1 Tax=Paracoccus sp. TaxID=267 RepID=UPI003919D35E